MAKNAAISAEQLQLAIDEERGESERACILVCAAKVDRALENLLRAHFRRCSDADEKEHDFFLSQRPVPPLGGFAVKARVARVLGLIDGRLSTAILHLAKIRNDFAHSEHPSPLTAELGRPIFFAIADTGMINDESLNGIGAILDNAGNVSEENGKKAIRAWFTLGTSFIVMAINREVANINTPKSQDQASGTQHDPKQQ